jgi:hypothetical protein
MRVGNVPLQLGGLSTENFTKLNSGFATSAFNISAISDGLEIKKMSQRLAEIADIVEDVAFPYPQIFVCSDVTLVCTQSCIYEYDNPTRATKLYKVFETALTGKTWSVADFGLYIILSNGNVVVTKDPDTKEYADLLTDEHSTIPLADCFANFNGQVFAGGVANDWHSNYIESIYVPLSIYGTAVELINEIQSEIANIETPVLSLEEEVEETTTINEILPQGYNEPVVAPSVYFTITNTASVATVPSGYTVVKFGYPLVYSGDIYIPVLLNKTATGLSSYSVVKYAVGTNTYTYGAVTDLTQDFSNIGSLKGALNNNTGVVALLSNNWWDSAVYQEYYGTIDPVTVNLSVMNSISEAIFYSIGSLDAYSSDGYPIITDFGYPARLETNKIYRTSNDIAWSAPFSGSFKATVTSNYTVITVGTATNFGSNAIYRLNITRKRSGVDTAYYVDVFEPTEVPNRSITFEFTLDLIPSDTISIVSLLRTNNSPSTVTSYINSVVVKHYPRYVAVGAFLDFGSVPPYQPLVNFTAHNMDSVVSNVWKVFGKDVSNAAWNLIDADISSGEAVTAYRYYMIYNSMEFQANATVYSWDWISVSLTASLTVSNSLTYTIGTDTFAANSIYELTYNEQFQLSNLLYNLRYDVNQKTLVEKIDLTTNSVPATVKEINIEESVSQYVTSGHGWCTDTSLLYLLGGTLSTGGFSNSFGYIDLTNGDWVTLTDFPLYINSPALALVNNTYIYSFGGKKVGNITATEVYRYVIASGLWEFIDNIATSTANGITQSQICVIGQKVYWINNLSTTNKIITIA